MTTRRINRRPAAARTRVRQQAPGYGVPSARGPISPRAVMMLLLCGGPVLLICISFFFGVGLQALGLVSTAKHGSVLGSMGGIALTVLVAAFFCVPGYLVAVIWFGIKSKVFPDDVEMLKKKTMLIPLVALIMFWVPAVLVPNISIGVRAQVAILTVVVMLIFGYIWIALVRIAIGLFMKIGVIQHSY